MESEKYERVMAAIHCRVPDRVPWTLWGHFPALRFLEGFNWEKANRDGEELARAHIALLKKLDFTMDLLKITPFFKFMAYQWGSKFRFTNNEESVETVDVAVKKTKDWKELWVLDPRKELKENLRTVSILARAQEVGGSVPFIYTIPSPFVQALHHVSTPDRVFSDLKSQPGALKEGLETIAQTCIDFGKACIDEGATGIFYAVGSGGKTWANMNRKQLEDFVVQYDNEVLNALRNAPIKLLHVCGDKLENPQINGGLMEQGWFQRYPVDAINWWDKGFTPSSVAKEIYGGKFCIVAGIDQRHTMRYGTTEQVENEVRTTIEKVAGKGGLIVGPGCTLLQDTPLANFNAVARAVLKHGSYRS